MGNAAMGAVVVARVPASPGRPAVVKDEKKPPLGFGAAALLDAADDGVWVGGGVGATFRGGSDCWAS